MTNILDEVITGKPVVCTGYQNPLQKNKYLEVYRKRQRFDIPSIQLVVKEYQQYSSICTNSRYFNKGAYQADISSPEQYGSGVKALVTLLHQNGDLLLKKIQTLRGDLFSAPLNDPSIMEYQRAAFDKLVEEDPHIVSQLIKSDLVHANETGIRCISKLQWLHSICNNLFTYQFVHPKRGIEAHEEPQTFFHELQELFVHDCWLPFFEFENANHVICDEHILRELEALIEQKSIWANKFKLLLLELYEKAVKNIQTVPEAFWNKFLRKYQRILKSRYQEELFPITSTVHGRHNKIKVRNLLERKDSYSAVVLTVVFNDKVAFTNNRTQRDIRMSKTKPKVVGCYRTFNCAQFYPRINAFISSNQNINSILSMNMRMFFMDIFQILSTSILSSYK